jgi:hypothetical protein
MQLGELMMFAKDLVGNEVGPGDHFAYALTVGRSASLAIYKFVDIKGERVRAIKKVESYGSLDMSEHRLKMRHQKHMFNEATGRYEWMKLSPEEIEKIDNKTSSLGKFSERAILLKDYKA